ncbi:MAG: MmgE/PrpD family protein [Acidimicrobiia bacterium]
MGATDQLAEMADSLRWDHLDTETRHRAVRHLLDTVGVMVAGASGDVTRRATIALDPNRSEGGVPVPGRDEPSGLLDAAFLGGTAAHGMELDDGYREGTVHPGVCVIPAALALACGTATSGVELLESVVVGYEAVIAVARACHPALREGGFHPTSATGVFGSALAGARLLGLTSGQATHALGLAASSAGGLFAFLAGGGDVKRLHAGNASRGGLLAALLAAEGVEGPPAVLEGKDGFAEAFAGGFARPFAVAPGGRYGIADCYVKPYPCCRHLQPAAEALFAIRLEEGVAPDEIERIEVQTYSIAAQHARARWDTFAGAQLSMPYVCALAARDGAITMESFADNTRSDRALADLASKVTVSVDGALDASYPRYRPARVTVVTPRGRFTRESLEALGSDRIPLDDDGLSEKFVTLVSPVLGSDRADELLDALWKMETAGEARSVVELAVPES